MRSSATLASAMSSSRIGPCPHHSDNRCPSTNRSSPNRSRYSKRATSGSTVPPSIPAGRSPPAGAAPAAPPTSVHPHAAGRLIELRVTIGLVIGGIEEGTAVPRARRDDRRAGHDPDAHDLTPARVDVAGILQGDLRVRRVHAPGMLVRGAVLCLDEHLPERPLVAPGLVGGGGHGFRSQAPASGRGRRAAAALL